MDDIENDTTTATRLQTHSLIAQPGERVDMFAFDDGVTGSLLLDSASIVPRRQSISIGQVWSAYRLFVRSNHVMLHLADEAVTRLLIWMPHDIVRSPIHDERTSSRRRWREVCFGLLSLHRMFMDLALQDVIINSYGTTMSLGDEEPCVPATSIRICLTVLHDLMPTLMELYSSSDGVGSSFHNNMSTTSAVQAKMRLHLERVKLLLRLAIAIPYWRELWAKNKNIPTRCQPLLLAGLVQDGGMFYPDEGSGDHPPTPTLMQEHSYARRQEYSGRRTGRRVVGSQQPTSTRRRPVYSNQVIMSRDMVQLLLGEMWNMYRPLYWAQVEATSHVTKNPSRSVMWWLMSLAMDWLSLKCLERFTITNNPMTKAEWNRRRMKLFLYVLRSPFWDRATFPAVERFASVILQQIPLLGRILESYLWDWIYYWKHPWASERD